MNRSTDRCGRELALSEVVGFVLLLGVIVAAMALWMMYIVPMNGREDEIDQMNHVKDRFTDYKISLDSLWINSPYGASYDQNGITLSTSLNLGTGGGNTQVGGLFLPMMNPIASPAVVAVRDTGDTMTVTYYSTTTGMVSTPYNMTILEYRSQNYYWIQQDYYYQSGGVFLKQDNGSVCRVAPPISLVNTSGNITTINVVPIRLYGLGSMGGTGPVRIDTRMKTIQSPLQGQESRVNISVNVADYTTAKTWLEVLNASRRNGGITDANSYRVGIATDSSRRGIAWMDILGAYTSDTAQNDIVLKVQPVEYDVTLNSLASYYS